MRAGRSQRAHTTPESTETSPDCSPWVMHGRSAARLRQGLAGTPAAVRAADDRLVRRNSRRVSACARDACRSLTAIGPPPSNHGGTCPRRLTERRHLCDGQMKRVWCCCDGDLGCHPGRPAPAARPGIQVPRHEKKGRDRGTWIPALAALETGIVLL